MNCFIHAFILHAGQAELLHSYTHSFIHAELKVIIHNFIQIYSKYQNARIQTQKKHPNNKTLLQVITIITFNLRRRHLSQ